MVNSVKRTKDDIFNMPIIGFIFKNPKFLFALRIIISAIFFYALYFGFANPTKENVFTNAIFWGIFWSLFQVSTLPTFGRVICTVCPHGFFGKYITKLGLQKTMPKWLQNKYIGLFLLVIGWWGILYSFPGFWRTTFSTVAMFAGITIIAFLIYFLYKDMGYCKYICPVGTINSAFDKLAITKLETYTNECKTCKTFDCAKACSYNLKPFTFAKKNSTDDCALCMDCANSCEAVKFKFAKPANKLDGKFKGISAEVWAYILIVAAISVSMAFAHGLNRSNVADEMIWNRMAISIGQPNFNGMFSFLFSIILTVTIAVFGLWLSSKVLKQNYKTTFTTLGYAYAPLFIIGSLGHTIGMFFTRGYKNIIEGFAQVFGANIEVASLAERGDIWLQYLDIFKWIGVAWALFLLYKRLKLIDTTNGRKIAAYFFASFLIIFFVAVNVYRNYIIDTYGRKPQEHNMNRASINYNWEKYCYINNSNNILNNKNLKYNSKIYSGFSKTY